MNCRTYADSSEISGIFRHSMRANTNYRNGDIDLSISKDNYQVGVERAHPFEYYKERLSQVYCYNRADVKTLVEWVVTIPRDTPPTQEHEFFDATYDFLTERFCGGNDNNVALAVVHKDEKRVDGAPRAHMHYYFLPIVPDKKHAQGEKICKKEAMPKATFKTVHPDLQAYLMARGIKGNVNSGITATQRRNYLVKEIKNGVRDRIEKRSQEQTQQQQEENFFTGKTLNNTWFEREVEQHEEQQR